jgi:amidohydrolase
MASADIWDLKIQGKGGHGAMPHKAVDPTVTAATVISTLQTVVSREMDPQETVVLSVGKMEAGTAVNIIPDTARVAGNVRTTSREVRAQMEGIMKRVADGICAAMRCTAELTYTPIYPVTVNDPEVTAVMRSAAADISGGKHRGSPRGHGVRGFQLYGEKSRPPTSSSHRDDERDGQPAPQSKFNVNDDVLPSGAALLAAFAVRMTGRSS